MSEVFVGRQSIYNRSLEVVGYELLFRRGQEEVARFEDGDQATSQVILNAFHQIGIFDVVGTRLAFVNLTRGFIVGDFDLPVPTEGVVLEVLEHIDPDEEVLRGLRDLKARGYTIALDDFVLNDRTATMLEFASLIKMDIVDLGWSAVESQVASLRKHGLSLLAEQVRTLQDFERCRELGFELYQGYFLSRPYTVRGRQMNANRLAVVHELEAHLGTMDEQRETGNAFGKLNNWHQRLGEHGCLELLMDAKQLQPAAQRALAAAFAFCQLKERPRDVFQNAWFRAAMCAELCDPTSGDSKPDFFIAGLLSSLDSLLECSLPRIIEDLPLSTTIRIALLSNTGIVGEALACIFAYEEGAWDRVAYRSRTPVEIRAAYLAGIRWSESATLALDAFQSN